MTIPASGQTNRRTTVGWRHRAIVLTLLLIGTMLRMADMGTAPPGLYHDEAQHGIDALTVLSGQPAFYFPANNGREPIFIYLVTAAVAILGRSPLAIRLPSCYVGILTLAAVYDLGRTLWNRKVGWWGLAIMAVTFWHVHLSRMGFRAVLLPLLTALILSQTAKGIRYHRTGHWIAAGVLYGASWYTYNAARFTPVAVGVMLLYGLAYHRDQLLELRRSIVLAATAAVVVLLPLGVFTLVHPDIVLARSGQVSIFSEEINHGRFWATLGSHILKTAGMFTVQGDRIWRHNLALRPVWDPALSLAFLIGVGTALSAFRRDAGAALALLWTGVMAVPTLLAEDAPHFLRGVGVLPTAALLPAIGLGWITTHLEAHRTAGRRVVAGVLPVAFLSFGLISTTYDYFFRYTSAPLAYHWLEGGAVALAAEVNQLREEGWDGTKMLQRDAAQPASKLAPEIYFDPNLWAEWTAIPFLLPESAVSFLPTDARFAVDREAVFVVWPYRAWEQDILPTLARPTYIQARTGPEAQGDLDPEPYSIATIVKAGPRPEVPTPAATFERGIVLRAALVETGQDTSTVNLWWETTTPVENDYTVFVHYLRSGERIAQHDAPPGLGHLATTVWQPGDLILDRHPVGTLTPIPDTDTLLIGLYDTATGEGLRILDESGSAQANAIEIPVIPVKP